MGDHSRSAGAPHARRDSLDPSSSPTTAQVELSADEFVLGGLFEHAPGARAELTPAIATPDSYTLLDLQTTSTRGTIETVLRTDPNIAAFEPFAERENGWVYRVTLGGRARRLVRRLLAAGITLLAAQAHTGQWEVRVVAPDGDTLSRTHDITTRLGYTPDYTRICPFEGRHSDRTELTEKQRETLCNGFKTGYFDIPRETTAAELAAILGITHQALSERLRRAHRQLIENTLVVDDDRSK